MNNTYKVAGIDVHKSMLAVVIADVAAAGEFRWERRKFGTVDSELRALSAWLEEQQVREAVMESTAQYWKPVWRQLEGQCQLFLAQAHSNRAPKGRKRDFQDAERLVRRHVAGELILSFVPDPEQRLWRTLTRAKYQLTRDRVRLHSQIESLLEDARIKLATRVSDLLGLSSRKMLQALAAGQTDPAALAALAEPELRATPEQLADALQDGNLERQHRLSFARASDTKTRYCGQTHHCLLDSAEQVIAEVGPQAATFDSPGQMASWVGVCPGREESAEASKSDRSPKGNRVMRRVLNQVANAAVKTKGSIFQSLYRRLMPRLGHNKTIWAVAHRLCRLTWKILHQRVDYIEYGPQRDQKALQHRLAKLARQLRSFGYQVTPPPAGANV